MWAFARIRLGLSKDEFFSLTPSMFWKMQESWKKGQRDQLRLVSLLRMDVINCSMRAPKEPIQLRDLLQDEDGLSRSTVSGIERPKMTRKVRTEIANGWRRFGMMMAGESS